jgi:hypothetical protein
MSSDTLSFATHPSGRLQPLTGPAPNVPIVGGTSTGGPNGVNIRI